MKWINPINVMVSLGYFERTTFGTVGPELFSPCRVEPSFDTFPWADALGYSNKALSELYDLSI